MKSLSKILTALSFLAVVGTTATANDFAVKTNLLYDATASVNIGFETGIARQWTLDVNGDLNFWNINDKRWRHWFVQPEFRYWFCNRSIGHFVAIQLHGGQYNLGNWGVKGFNFLGTDFRNLRDRRYQGWFAGAGVAYGYSWAFNEHWGMEAEIGIGWAYSRFDAYPCRICGNKIIDNGVHNYVGPTKIALNLVYNF